MAKFQSPLLGYNNNVRHRGRVFHIQTEDSGVAHPHVITHLFMDGGRILKSVKKSYAEHVGNEGLQETVRVLMKEQHKAMFIALRDGQFDELVDGPKKGHHEGPNAEVPGRRPPTSRSVAREGPRVRRSRARRPAAWPDDGPQAVAPPPMSSVDAPPADRARSRAAEVAADQRRRSRSKRCRRTRSPSAPRPSHSRSTRTVRRRSPSQSRRRVRDALSEPIHRPSAAAELTLDFDALERDSGVPAGPMFQPNDLPPPPKNLFAKERGTGAYSALEVEAHQDDTREGRRAALVGRRRGAPRSRRR